MFRKGAKANENVRGGPRGRVQGVRTPRPREMTCGFLIQLVFCQKKKTMGFIGVEVEQETSAPPSKKNPVSAPERGLFAVISHVMERSVKIVNRSLKREGISLLYCWRMATLN